MTTKIFLWSEIEANFNHSTIVLGNGASIAVNERFRYPSLKEYAEKQGLLTDDIQKIFDFFHTSDFELILRIVWHATNVNHALGVEDSQTTAAYEHVRDCLIKVIREIHCSHDEINGQLSDIYQFLKRFNRVISLNYDLIVYWAMMHGNEISDGHAFKDCFTPSYFEDDWSKFDEPIRGGQRCSLVFYPHGNLILARDKIENEKKLTAGISGLLEEILAKWENASYVPLFVSEGTAEQKRKSISSSYYLNTVYREVLVSLPKSLVVYGWSFSEQDNHLIERLALSGFDKIAVSILNNNQADCNRITQIIKDKVNENAKITFFDCESPGCWNNPDEK